MEDEFTGKRILVLEDQELLREAYSERLKKSGFIVTKAANENDALEAIRNVTFHIAWVDLTLGGQKSADRKGYDVIEKLNALNEGTKIVIVTQHTTREEGIKEARRAFTKAGAHDFIPKSLATRDAWPQCLETLKDLLANCQIDNNASVLEAQKNIFEKNSGEIIIGNIIHRFRGQFDAAMLLNSLSAAYNKIKPVRLHKERTFQWDEENRIFKAQFWSRAIGSPVELMVGSYSTADTDVILFQQTKGVPVTIRKIDESRDRFKE